MNENVWGRSTAIFAGAAAVIADSVAITFLTFPLYPLDRFTLFLVCILMLFPTMGAIYGFIRAAERRILEELYNARLYAGPTRITGG
jgi:hypothetical protein